MVDAALLRADGAEREADHLGPTLVGLEAQVQHLHLADATHHSHERCQDLCRVSVGAQAHQVGAEQAVHRPAERRGERRIGRHDVPFRVQCRQRHTCGVEHATEIELGGCSIECLR